MLKFNSIENGEIFTRDFRPFAKNNEISFPTCGEEIVAIYGPNGTGKTALSRCCPEPRVQRSISNLMELPIPQGMRYFM